MYDIMKNGFQFLVLVIITGFCLGASARLGSYLVDKYQIPRCNCITDIMIETQYGIAVEGEGEGEGEDLGYADE